jgi:hypothetical protein
MFRAFLMVLILTCASAVCFGQTNCEAGNGLLDSEYPKSLSPEQIASTFAANESMLAAARDNYSYTQETKVQTFWQRNVDGEYRQVADVSHNAKGEPVEHVTFAPVSSLRRISITLEDLDDIREFGSFMLTAKTLPQYKIDYAGQQTVDRLKTYVFDIAPVRMEPKERYFKGRVWVDSTDLQIVKTCGKRVPDLIRTKKGKKGSEENILPVFVSYRQFIDDRYWFPAYTRSDDTLNFARDQVPIRVIVKYTKYGTDRNGAVSGH